MGKAFRVGFAIVGSAITALVMGFVFAGMAASGVIAMHLTHALFWVAFILSILAAPTASWFAWRSFKTAAAVCFLTISIVGGGLLWLDSWLHNELARQAASNRPPVIPSLAGPGVPIKKTETLHKSSRMRVDQRQNNSGGNNIQQQSSGTGISNAAIGNGNIVGNTTYNLNQTPAVRPQTGIIGARDSTEITNTDVHGFDNGIDLSPSKIARVDRTTVTGTGETSSTPKASPELNDSAIKISGGPVEFDQGIFDGGISAEDSSGLVLKDSVVMSEADNKRAIRNLTNTTVMKRIRDHRTDPRWLRGYLVKMRSFFEGWWTSLPANQHEHNEDLFTEFEDSVEGATFDEKKSIALLDELLDATPPRQP